MEQLVMAATKKKGKQHRHLNAKVIFLSSLPLQMFYNTSKNA